MLFADLRLAEPILRALVSEGYSTATPIQAQAIPHAMAGKDVFGCAQTGTGKTAAFALPILHRLNQNPRPTGAKPTMRALILAPTRELANQISEGFKTYGKNLHLKHATVYGGVSQHHQVLALRNGADIVVATPGRFLDLMNQGHINLSAVEVLVLDEADRMLDMGFIHDIKRVVTKLPSTRQTMFFSATMPREIKQLADAMLRDPVNVQVTPVATLAVNIDESVYFVEKKNKPALLAHLFTTLPMARAIVFSRTKHGADKVVQHLHKRGIKAEAIHGNKSQNVRQRALDNFKAGRIPILVATDIASRGIDVDNISHVVNFDLTHEPETYVHRIGRTARAGSSGAAVSFVDKDERSNLRAIEKLLRKPIPVKNNHPDYEADLALRASDKPQFESDDRRATRDHTPRDHAPRERTRREHTPREHAPREHAPREHAPRASHVETSVTPEHSPRKFASHPLTGHAKAKSSHTSVKPLHTGAKPSHTGAKPLHTGAKKPSHASAKPSHTGAKPAFGSAKPARTGQPFGASSPRAGGARPQGARGSFARRGNSPVRSGGSGRSSFGSRGGNSR